MALDLSSLNEQRRNTIRLEGALEGFEIELRHRGLKERDRFRQKLLRDGIMKSGDKGDELAQGRISDFIVAFATEVITGWTVPERFRQDKEENPPYDPKELAKILDASPDSATKIFKASTDESAFFGSNGKESGG